MSFAVLHMQKIKGNGVTGMQIHNQREKESDTNQDIEKDRSYLNYDLVNQDPVDYHKKVNQMIGERVDQSKRKVRKDAVKVASFMITSDKDFFEKIGEKEEKRFFETAYDFIGKQYGKENIAYAMVHKDEKTPHMHLGLVPITEDNRLSAKDYFGKKQQLYKLQDDFHSHMLENGFDLERGVSSDKKHLETAKFKLQTVQEKTKELQEKLEKIEQIDEIENKVKEGRFTNKVTIAKEDFQAFKDVAKAGILVLDENKLLGAKLDDLRASNTSEVQKLQESLKRAENERDEVLDTNMQLSKENQQLKTEKKTLLQENKFLSQTIEMVKVHFKDQVQELGEKIGLLKASVLEKMGLSLFKKYFSDKEEIQGGQDYLRFKRIDEKQKDIEKQNERDEPELE